MEQGDAIKKKRRLVKKYQSPIRNREVDPEINVRSSGELVRKYVLQSNKKLEGMLKKTPEIHKSYQPMASIDGNKQCTQEERKKKQPNENYVTHSTRSHQSQGNMNDKAEANLPSKGIGTRNATESDAFVHQDQQNQVIVKKKSSNPAMHIDEFLAKQGVHVEREEQLVGGSVNDEHMLDGDDNDDVDAEHNILDCVGDQIMGTTDVEGISKKKMTRGKTTCKHIHARTWEEREEVTFDNGQAVGPTQKRVNELSHFLGTLGRNSNFISLVYTSWHAVPDETKKRLWKYVKSKFIIPKEGKRWVMDGIRDAWRRYKTNIKKNHFDKFDNKEDMLKNCPPGISEVQFKSLIAYWSLPCVQAMCSANSENRKKQQWGHRMGSINFGRVGVGLRESSESKEEPTQLDVFVATRTGRKGKELEIGTQSLIEKVNNHQVEGETAEGAFQAVFGKERPGRIRCYGRTVTARSLKKNKEINQIKQQHAMEKESLEGQLKDTNERVQGLQDIVGLLMQQSNPNFNIEEALAALRAKQSSPGDGNSARGPMGLSSTSTHVPKHD